MEIGIGELGRIMRECAGADESVDLDGDIMDVTFADLGYDSLALLEITARVSREYRIDLGDDAEKAQTPGEFLALANSRLATAV